MKKRALELSLTPEHMAEVQRLMEQCKREELEEGFGALVVSAHTS